MRRCYLVAYDIREPKRLRKIHTAIRGYGEAWQYSVYFCVLKDIDRVRLQAELEEHMNLKEDQAIIIDLGMDEEMARKSIKTIGLSLPESKSRIIVI